MSDEEDESLSEGFSASEDEWMPSKDVRGGESSDDDDSDFESPAAAVAPGPSSRTSAGAAKKKSSNVEQKTPSGIKGAAVKKRKASGQSLRSKLYNKYRPPPKTFPTSPSAQNSPSASGSNRVTASKNAKTPNESDARERNVDSSSESSVEDYLVNPADIDLHSSYFTAPPAKEKSPAPLFDCNAGMGNLSDSGTEDDNESSNEDNAGKAFDFRSLLENANSLERTKDALAQRAANAKPSTSASGITAAESAAMDVNALLALGENQNYVNEQKDEKERGLPASPPSMDGPARLSKTKSTRIKRHIKTRPASTVVAAGDTDDSEWEEVAEAEQSSDDHAMADVSGDLEIHVHSRQPTKEQKTQHELELALKRRMNRDIKERQLLLHKVSLMCLMARSYKYNRLLGDASLLAAALKLLPSKNAYPTERGTELKYLQSFVTWFKTAIKLCSPNLYPDKTAKSKRAIVEELLAQIKRKEARCKQDMVFIFVVLARGMGMHCRLIVNMQPMPMRPAAGDLIPIKLKQDEAAQQSKNSSKAGETVDDDDDDDEEKEQESKARQHKAKSKQKVETDVKHKPSNALSVSKSNSNGKSTKEKPVSLSSKVKTEPVGKSVAIEKVALQKERGEHKAETRTKNSRTTSKHDRNVPKPSTSHVSGSSGSETKAKPQLSRLKRPPACEVPPVDQKQPKLAGQSIKSETIAGTPIARRLRNAINSRPANVPGQNVLPVVKSGSPVIPKLVLQGGKQRNAENANPQPSANNAQLGTRDTRSRSKSPRVHISPAFLQANSDTAPKAATATLCKLRPKSQDAKIRISPTFLQGSTDAKPPERVLRSRQQKAKAASPAIPQLDGVDDSIPKGKQRTKSAKPKKSHSNYDSDEDFEPTPAKQIKKSPVLPKAVQQLRTDRRVLSTDDDEAAAGGGTGKRKATASDMWLEVWSEVEEQWICIDLFKGKLHCVDTIRRNASPNLAYVFAFQDDLSLKDVTARYCASWTMTVRKGRVEKAWLDKAVAPYLGRRTTRDICEDVQLRRIHEEKPLPKSISEFKDHPLYALERHLLKFQGIYPPDAPTIGFIRGEAIYARECVHLLHSRDIWLKQARVVKLGEQPYKVVKARPKWDKLTRSVIKDQPLEIFGYWQTQDYEPPTAENGIVPRNAYGNVELFKACMLPKKTVHLRLPGLMRVCKKLNIDCANAVIGFDFHQGACHPMYDGFVVCEEYRDVVTAAWYQDQEEQARKEQEKYEARVYGNWRKLIRGLLVRERLKKKYNF